MIRINIVKEKQALVEAHLEFICAQSAIGFMKIQPSMVKVSDQFFIKISQHIKWKGILVLIVENHEFMDIIKHLVQEKKDLQKRLDVLEEILHSYIPIIDKENKDGQSNRRR